MADYPEALGYAASETALGIGGPSRSWLARTADTRSPSTRRPRHDGPEAKAARGLFQTKMGN